jgi:hypothetical protein
MRMQKSIFVALVRAVTGIIVTAAATAVPVSFAHTAQDVSATRQQPEPFTGAAPEPMQQFHDDVQLALVQRLGTQYPKLKTYLEEETPQASEASYPQFVFKFLDDAALADHGRQAAMLLAGDFLATKLSCRAKSEKEHGCDELRNRFVRHKMSIKFSELDARWLYQHDLLWRVWRDYRDTDWGDRAFVLLLDSGWDTSGTCSQGEDQFRAVIKQGESFLEQQPAAPYRPFVLHLVGEAYAAWWTLSRPEMGLDMYADPKSYRDGADTAPMKAIRYFQQVQEVAPSSALGEYAGNIIPALQQRRAIVKFRFLCIYD